MDVPPYAPFWAITKHADVMDIERDNELFTNDPRPFLEVAEFDEKQRAEREAGVGLRTLIHTDDPHHRDLRKIGADWFKPSALKALKVRCDELAKIWVDKMAEKGPELDFAQDIAVNYPLYVILTLLGMPESDFAFMLKLTQELFGQNDEEMQRDANPDAFMAVIMDMFAYFTALTASRREHPTDDLASAIANATINGEPMSDMDTLSYYAIVASAGHDTTSAGIAGGLLALIQNPDQLARLQARSVADGHRGRGDDPLGGAGQGVHAHRPGRHRGPRRADQEGRRGAAVATSRPTATKRSSPTRCSSTSAATRTSTCRSATACTSASARHWRAWR